MKPILIVYDGHCPMCCQAMAKWRTRYRDGVQGVDFRTVPSLETIHPDLSREACEARIHVVDQGRVYVGAAGIVRVLRLSPVYRPLLWLYRIPPLGWCSEVLYRMVAANRFRLSRWFGRADECDGKCTYHGPKR